MVNLFSNKLEILIFLICFVHISRGYKTISIEDDDLCSPLTKGNISLGIGKLSALILSLNNITVLQEQEDKWEDEFICEFQITIPQGDSGIFAVIQKISFRKNYETNECIDYVRYRRYDGTLSGKYCGEMGIDYQFEANDSLVTTNSFVEYDANLLNVYINISKTPLEPDENLELEIAFTAYRNCLKNFSFLDRDTWCWEGFIAHCISRSFSRDGYFNCPFYRCTDEGGCPRFASETPSPTSELQKGDYVLMSLVGIAILGLVVVCAILNLKSCSCQQTADDSVIIENVQYIEMDTTVGSEYRDEIPHEEGPPGYHDVVHPEESPPTYDSLFSD